MLAAIQLAYSNSLNTNTTGELCIVNMKYEDHTNFNILATGLRSNDTYCFIIIIRYTRVSVYKEEH